jgi:uncharacterized membrane protein
MWDNIRKRENFFDVKKARGNRSAARVDVGLIRGGFDEVSRGILGLLFGVNCMLVMVIILLVLKMLAVLYRSCE